MIAQANAAPAGRRRVTNTVRFAPPPGLTENPGILDSGERSEWTSNAIRWNSTW
jgi:hypothetical protein